MASKETNNPFWTIIGANFPEYDQRTDDVEWAVFHASLDYRITRQTIGNSVVDVYLAEKLERDYGLTIEQAFQAIELGSQRGDSNEE